MDGDLGLMLGSLFSLLGCQRSWFSVSGCGRGDGGRGRLRLLVRGGRSSRGGARSRGFRTRWWDGGWCWWSWGRSASSSGGGEQPWVVSQPVISNLMVVWVMWNLLRRVWL